MRPRVILVGATGAFGSLLARRLVAWPDVELVLAARDRRKLEALADQLGPDVEVAVFDRNAPAALGELAPFAVIDCAGPWQGADYAFPRAVLAAGAHYLDIADARAFVAGFGEALDAEAKAAGRLAVSGASSTPALTAAALDALTEGWSRIDAVETAIAPGARAPAGLAVVRAILSWAGQPVSVFTGGRWRTRAGWSGIRRPHMPGLGRRWLALAETPDLDVLAARFTPRREAVFRAGVEVGIMHLGLWALTWLARLRLLRSLQPLAKPLLWLIHRLQPLGSDRGGMTAVATGAGAVGEAVAGRFALWSWDGAGPNVPTLAAQAILRGLLEGRITARGAQSAPGLVNVDEILTEAAGLPIRTRIDRAAPADPCLWRRLFGADFDAFPPAVRQVHAGLDATRFEGRARVRGGRSVFAALGRAVSGTPRRGLYPHFAVEMTPNAHGEAWRRVFGRRAFASRISDVKGDIGRYEERLGLLAFRFEGVRRADGFDWRMLGWRLGPLPLPMALAPRIRARSFARDGVYRFRVLVSHPLAGLIVGYAGRLNSSAAPGVPRA